MYQFKLVQYIHHIRGCKRANTHAMYGRELGVSHCFVSRNAGAKNIFLNFRSVEGVATKLTAVTTSAS